MKREINLFPKRLSLPLRIYLFQSLILFIKDIEYFIKVLYINKTDINDVNNGIAHQHSHQHSVAPIQNDLHLSVQISGEKCDTPLIPLTSQNHVKQQENSFRHANENEKMATFRVLMKNVGKVNNFRLFRHAILIHLNKIFLIFLDQKSSISP